MNSTLAALIVAGSVVSCSDAAPATSLEAGAFPAEPFVTTTSDAGTLHVEVRTAPSQPPARGVCSVELTVTDAKGVAVDDLKLDVVPWMPAMGHGTSITPTVAALGAGKYLVTNVSLFMAGDWELRTSFEGPVRDRAAPAFQIR